MSLLHIEGWGGIGTTTATYKEYVRAKYRGLTSNLEVEPGRKSGQAIKFVNGSYVAFPTLGGDVHYVGFAWKANSVPGSGNWTPILQFYQVEPHSQLLQVQLQQGNGGELAFTQTSSTTVLHETSGLGLVANTWYYIEAYLKSGTASVGALALRVNGVEEINASPTATRFGFPPAADRIDEVRIVATGALGPRHSYDDIYVLDDAGSTNNSFLGDCQVTTIYPNAAGDSSDFSPQSGSNFENVDDGETLDEANYVESDTAANRDLYGYENVTIPTSIFGLQVNTDCELTGTSPFDIKQVAKSGATTDVGPAESIWSDQNTVRRRLLEQDPDTTSAWTQSGINGAQFGFEVG